MAVTTEWNQRGQITMTMLIDEFMADISIDGGWITIIICDVDRQGYKTLEEFLGITTASDDAEQESE